MPAVTGAKKDIAHSLYQAIMSLRSDRDNGQLWMPGEERFGRISSRCYSLASRSRTMKKFHEFVMGDLLSLDFSTVLDIGCGPGTVLLSLAQNREGLLGSGIDPSIHMVRIASGRARRLGLLQRVKFAQGSNRYIPLEDRFDVIYTSLSFHHWKDNAESITGIMQRLKERGRFIVYEITDDGSLARKFLKAHLMSKENFEAVSARTGIKTEVREEEGFIRAIFTR